MWFSILFIMIGSFWQLLVLGNKKEFSYLWKIVISFCSQNLGLRSWASLESFMHEQTNSCLVSFPSLLESILRKTSSAFISASPVWLGPIILYMDLIIVVISSISIHPFPSTSYKLNAQLSFSSGIPSEVTSIARRNSLKSTTPF